MSYNPFSIDNILANNVPKKSSPEVKHIGKVFSPTLLTHCHSQLTTPTKSTINDAQVQELFEDQQTSSISAHINTDITEGSYSERSTASTASGRSSPNMTGTPSSKSSMSSDSNPTTSTPCPRSRNQDQNNSLSPCQLSPVPSTGKYMNI